MKRATQPPVHIKNMIKWGEKYKIENVEIGGRTNTSGKKIYLTIDFVKKTYSMSEANAITEQEVQLPHDELIIDQLTRTMINDFVAQLKQCGYKLI